MIAPKRSAALAGALSVAANAAALAQNPSPPDKPMPAHAPAPPTPIARPGAPGAALRGPTVVARSGVPSLVHHAFDGSLRRLQIDPAEAALELLSLDEGARQRALGILDKRAAILDRIVRRNLGRLTELQTAAESGRVFRVLQIASDLHRQFTRDAGEAPLVDQVAGVLPSRDAQRLRDLVGEYWTALIHDEAGERVGRIEAFVIRRRAALEVFGKEIERAVQRITTDLAGADDTWERMLSALDLAPEQEREIRAMGREFYLGANLNPTKQDTADFLIRVYHKLDDGQREKFFQLVISAE